MPRRKKCLMPSFPTLPLPWPKSSQESLLPVAFTPPHSRGCHVVFPRFFLSLSYSSKRFLSFLWYLCTTVNKASYTSLQRKLLHFPLYPKLESPLRTHTFLLYPTLEANGWWSQTEELLARLPHLISSPSLQSSCHSQALPNLLHWLVFIFPLIYIMFLEGKSSFSSLTSLQQLAIL